MGSLEDPVVIRKNPYIGVICASEEESIENGKRKTDKNGPDSSYLPVFDLPKECGDEEDIAYVQIEPDP